MSSKFEVFLSNKAKKFYAKLPKNEKERVKEKLVFLEQDPFPIGYIKLKGRESIFRIRIGMYRVLYTVDTEKRSVLVFRIDTRETAYRGL